MTIPLSSIDLIGCNYSKFEMSDTDKIQKYETEQKNKNIKSIKKFEDKVGLENVTKLSANDLFTCSP